MSPGMGFMSFGASGLLAILSLILLGRALAKQHEEQIQPLFAGLLWKRIVILLASLAIYAWVMPFAGYLIATFLLMSFLYWLLEPNRITWAFYSVMLSLVTTVMSYYIFSVLLNCQFPSGVFGF